MAISPDNKRVRLTLTKAEVGQLQEVAADLNVPLSALLAELVRAEAGRRGYLPDEPKMDR